MKNLEHDIRNCPHIATLLADHDVAVEFYRAFCNVAWQYKPPDVNDAFVDIMKGTLQKWSCSWRYAGGMIADIRNATLSVNEDYLDFYCIGDEGFVSERVETELKKLGWYPILE